MPTDHRDWNARYEKGETPWDSPAPAQELARVLSEWSIEPCRVLELGCGTGTNAVYLAQQGFQVAANELSPLALERAREKAAQAGVQIDFHQGSLFDLPPPAEPYPLVFDRGVYHVLREVNLHGFLAVLHRVMAAGGWYLTLAGNANDRAIEGGPPRVSSGAIASELSTLFDLVQLREFRFDDVEIEGQTHNPLAWSALFRRRPTD